MCPKQRIGVLMGGVSSERSVSLKSGKAIYEVLKSCGKDAVAVDISTQDEDCVKDLVLSYDIDVAFLALHGGPGEDGTIQRILQKSGIPFTGSGPQASFLAMNKIASRRIFQAAGLDVPRHYVLTKKHNKPKSLNQFPVVVKPASGGSSIGLSIVTNLKDFKKAIELAFMHDKEVLVEEYIRGREMTVGIFADRPLEHIEIKPKAGVFDYKAKYEKGQTEYVVPARASQAEARLLKEAGLRAHQLLGCSFFSRADIILTIERKAFLLEVNTIPGFTETSLLPRAAAAAGIGFPELVLRILDAAFINKNTKTKINSKSYADYALS